MSELVNWNEPWWNIHWNITKTIADYWNRWEKTKFTESCFYKRWNITYSNPYYVTDVLNQHIFMDYNSSATGKTYIGFILSKLGSGFPINNIANYSDCISNDTMLIPKFESYQGMIHSAQSGSSTDGVVAGRIGGTFWTLYTTSDDMPA